MNAADFRKAIESSAAYAMDVEPVDVDQRLGTFVAYLAGSVRFDEPDMHELLWKLLGIAPPWSTATSPKVNPIAQPAPNA
jgi:hypothetical protein